MIMTLFCLRFYCLWADRNESPSVIARLSGLGPDNCSIFLLLGAFCRVSENSMMPRVMSMYRYQCCLPLDAKILYIIESIQEKMELNERPVKIVFRSKDLLWSFFQDLIFFLCRNCIARQLIVLTDDVSYKKKNIHGCYEAHFLT